MVLLAKFFFTFDTFSFDMDTLILQLISTTIFIGTDIFIVCMVAILVVYDQLG